MNDYTIKIDPSTKTRLIECAQNRAEANNKYRKTYHAVLRPDQELLGIIAEWGLSALYKLEMDWEAYTDKRGDGGKDYILSRFSIDAKYTQSNYKYMTTGETIRSDLFVYLEYLRTIESVKAVGWEFGELMKKSPIITFGKDRGSEKPPHGRLKIHMRPMEDFDRLIAIGKIDGLSIEQYEDMIIPVRKTIHHSSFQSVSSVDSL